MSTAWIFESTPSTAAATALPSPALAWAASPPLEPAFYFRSAQQPLRRGRSDRPQLGLDEGDISLQLLMTHAEAACNRESRIMHEQYGPMIWDGPYRSPGPLQGYRR